MDRGAGPFVKPAIALTMVIESGSHDRLERMVREWLLVLLRFAVTCDSSDRSAVIAMADELDSLGELRWRPAAPSFFRRTSERLIGEILAGGCADGQAILQTHIARIEDPRLGRAFRAAVGLTSQSPQREAKGRQRKAPGLWSGIPRK